MRLFEEGVHVALVAVALQLLLELLLLPAGDFSEDLHGMALDDLLHQITQGHSEHEADDEGGLLFRNRKIGVGLQGAIGIAFVEAHRQVAVVGQRDGVPVFPGAVVAVEGREPVDQVHRRAKKHVALDVQTVLDNVVLGQESRLQGAQGISDDGNVLDLPGMLLVDIVENAGKMVIKVLGVGPGVARGHAGQRGLREFPAEGVRDDRHGVSGVVDRLGQQSRLGVAVVVAQARDDEDQVRRVLLHPDAVAGVDLFLDVAHLLGEF